MRFLVKLSLTGLVLGFLVYIAGCSKETVDAPAKFGSITGQVLNAETGDSIQNASITTNPGTNAIVTDADGKFEISDVATGNYTVQAQKKGFDSKTVRIQVKENTPASVQILLNNTVTDTTNTGSITGQVQDSETGKGVVSASVSTVPGTGAVVTDSKGMFEINDVDTGNYTIKVNKQGYDSTKVQVNVKKDEKTNAHILLEKKTEVNPDKILKVEVTNLFNNSHDDSTFAEVHYLVSNKTERQSVSSFQLTFKIITNDNEFYSQVSGDSLSPGQESVGSFVKYVRDSQATSVKVSKIFAKLLKK